MAMHAPIMGAPTRAIPDPFARRAVLGLLFTAPFLGTVSVAPPGVTHLAPDRGHAHAASTPANALLARLDAHDATARKLDASDGSEAAWLAWSADGTVIFDAIERLPRTAENAAVKARAVMSIYSDDDLEDLISDDSTAGRLVLQLVRSLGSH